MKSLLIVNAGSSSLKFALFRLPILENSQSVFRGQVDGIGADTKFVVKDADGKVTSETAIAKQSAGGSAEAEHQAALDALLNWLDSQSIVLAGVGHRVLHGGVEYSAPVRVTPQVINYLDSLIPLGPLHQPHNLRPIRALARRHPLLPQVACFDTAFHRTQPRLSQIYAIPRKLTDAGVIRYGFHGLSYDYVSSQLPGVLGDKAHGNVIVAHLGNGASMCAMHDLKCVATSMGFTAAEGLMMGTRTGSIDPGVLLYLMEEHDYGVEEISRFIYSESGLLGVSGISQDMRTLEASSTAEAKEAVDLFCYRAAREIGSLSICAGGLDALVFTGGIGENSSTVRAKIVHYLGWLGATLDDAANAQRGKALRLEASSSRIALAMVPTNEEWLIAHRTANLLAQDRT